jgi:hypothetical protein
VDPVPDPLLLRTIETCVNFKATLWFPRVYNFHFSYPWTRFTNTQRRFVQESYLRGDVSANSFPRNPYMSQYLQGRWINSVCCPLHAGLVTVSLLSFYLCAGSGRSLNSSLGRVTAIAEATGNCTLEASPLFQINNTTSTVYLFEAKYYNFLCKTFQLSNFNDRKWSADEFRET